MSRPSSIQSSSDQCAGKSCFLAPLRDSLRSAIAFYVAITTTVIQLHIVSGPAAILRRIWAIYVNPINRVLTRWSLSHVRQEVHKRFTPALAHINTSASIAFIGWALRILTSSAHVRPRNIFACLRKAVSSVVFDDILGSSTTARCAFTVAKIAATHNSPSTTVATADPVKTFSWLGMISVCRLNYRQTPKSTSDCYLDAVSAHMGDSTLFGAY